MKKGRFTTRLSEICVNTCLKLIIDIYCCLK
ncbi:MAG: hypothetical protein ACJA08_003605 [Cyclobacteriaceae bacterium]